MSLCALVVALSGPSGFQWVVLPVWSMSLAHSALVPWCRRVPSASSCPFGMEAPVPASLAVSGLRYCDDLPITTVRADGLIIATPTGG